MKMETVHSFETSANSYWATGRHIPNSSNLYRHRCVDFKTKKKEEISERENSDGHSDTNPPNYAFILCNLFSERPFFLVEQSSK
jgi:hypothetical protein